jgi:hypothetical protein
MLAFDSGVEADSTAALMYKGDLYAINKLHFV